MKPIYELPVIELIELSGEDVITTSGNGIADPTSLGTPNSFKWSDLT
ncbi:MAG: hypothetical protein IJZ80_05765 [Clostridia bacterium]|nr:hypothetical protein [Clostridia bacterium]